MRKILTILIVFCLIIVFEGPSYGIVFDFENVPNTWDPNNSATRGGALTTLTMTLEGLTVSLSRSSVVGFDIVANTGLQAGKPPSWGLRSLDPFFSLPSNDFWIADFSMPLRSFSIDFGDIGPSDDDSPVNLYAYDGFGGMGSLLTSNTTSYPATDGFPAFKTLSVASGFPIASVVFESGGSNQFTQKNSLFWDNMIATPIPEPCSMLLLGIGLIGILGFRRRFLK